MALQMPHIDSDGFSMAAHWRRRLLFNAVRLCDFLFTVQNLEGLARALRLDKFLQLLFEAGLLDQLQTGPEMTLFVPTDKAFSS